MASKKSTRRRRKPYVTEKDVEGMFDGKDPRVVAIFLKCLPLLKPPPPGMKPSVWAERYRRLSPEASAQPGRWKNERTPYLVEFMDAETEPGVEAVVGVFASQTGKTEALLNVHGYHIHMEPRPSLMVQPTLEMAKTWSKDRLAPMIRDTPALTPLVSEAKTRDGANTVLHKQYPGGHSTVTGANSAAGLASRPIGHLECDEVDRYPESAGTEGDPLLQAEARTRTFGNATRHYISSPADEKTSRIKKLWDLSDQRYFMVPCHDCGKAQSLKWAQVQWDKTENDEPKLSSVRYVCEGCGARWTDRQRWANIRRGAWKATREFTGVAGFHLNGLYSLLGGRTLSTMVREWYSVKGNPQQLKVFVNTVLAEWWQEDAEETPDEDLMIRRREDWSAMSRRGAQVPRGAAVLTVGVDVQVDRIEYEVVGWGRGEESWSVDYGRILGNPRRDASVLKDFDEQVLKRAWIHEKGFPMFVRMACVDTGYATQAVYRFCKPRTRRGTPGGPQFVLAVKGRGNEPERPVWSEPSSTKGDVRVNLFTIGSQAAKDQVYGRLLLDKPGPGYMHFSTDRGRDYFEGLLAEEPRTAYRAGKRVRLYEPKVKGQPNEPLDCRQYAYAGIVALQSRPFLLNLEAEVLRVEGAPEREIVEGEPPAKMAVRKATRRRRSKGVL